PPPLTFTLFPYTTLFRSRDPLNVDAARGNIGRYKNAIVAILKSGKCSIALSLCTIAVDRSGGVSITFQFFGKTIRAVLSAREDRSEEHTSELQSQSNLVC